MALAVMSPGPHRVRPPMPASQCGPREVRRASPLTNLQRTLGRRQPVTANVFTPRSNALCTRSDTCASADADMFKGFTHTANGRHLDRCRCHGGVRRVRAQGTLSTAQRDVARVHPARGHAARYGPCRTRCRYATSNRRSYTALRPTGPGSVGLRRSPPYRYTALWPTLPPKGWLVDAGIHKDHSCNTGLAYGNAYPIDDSTFLILLIANPRRSHPCPRFSSPCPHAGRCSPSSY